MLLLLLACGGPLSGNYDFTVASTETDCPSSYLPPSKPEGLQTISVSLDTITLEGEPAEECPLEGMSFECDFAEVDETVDYNDDGLDAVYTIDLSMVGTWSEVDLMDGVTSVGTTCDGLDCDELAEQGAPSCTIAWYFTAELQ